jgi:hypothetical protein
VEHRCATCGAEGDDARAFARGERGSQLRRRRCNACEDSHTDRWVFRFECAAFAAAAAIAALLLLSPAWLADAPRTVASLVMNVVLLPPLLGWAAIAIHELGHAFAALALGSTVHRVQIGLGARLARVEIFGVPFEWNRRPRTGITISTCSRRRLYRTRVAVELLGGKLAETACLTALIAAALASDGRHPLALTSGINLLPAALAVFAYLIYVEIASWNEPPFTGDLKSLLQVIRMSDADVERSLRTNPLVPVMVAATENRLADALAMLRDAPAAPELGAMEAILLVELGSTDEAVARARDVRADAAAPPWLPALALASALWRRGAAEDLAEADALTREAVALAPRESGVHLTRGRVLSSTRDLDGAWSALSTALAHVWERSERGDTLCELAFVEARRGRLAAARMRLAEARAFGPSPHALERAERATNR